MIRVHGDADVAIRAPQQKVRPARVFCKKRRQVVTHAVDDPALFWAALEGGARGAVVLFAALTHTSAVVQHPQQTPLQRRNGEWAAGQRAGKRALAGPNFMLLISCI